MILIAGVIAIQAHVAAEEVGNAAGM